MTHISKVLNPILLDEFLSKENFLVFSNCFLLIQKYNFKNVPKEKNSENKPKPWNFSFQMFFWWKCRLKLLMQMQFTQTKSKIFWNDPTFFIFLMNENEFFYEQPLMQVIKTKFDIPITSNESNIKHKTFQPFKFVKFEKNK